MAADWLFIVFRGTWKGSAKKKVLAQLQEDVSGKWDVEVKFFASSARHNFELKTDGNRVFGTHRGEHKEGELAGNIDGGPNLRLRSQLPCDGFRLPYVYTGSVSQDRMSGKLDLGQLGHGKWTEQRA